MSFLEFFAIIIVVAAVSHLAVNIMNHRQNMAKLRAWRLDGDKIAAAAKKHLPIRDGHYVIPEEWKLDA